MSYCMWEPHPYEYHVQQAYKLNINQRVTSSLTQAAGEPKYCVEAIK